MLTCVSKWGCGENDREGGGIHKKVCQRAEGKKQPQQKLDSIGKVRGKGDQDAQQGKFR